MTDTPPLSDVSGAAPRSGGRGKGLALIAVVVLLAAAAWGGWHWSVARHYESTDNAYVAGNVVQITPQVGGTVVGIGADDTDYVEAGQLLVQLDAADTLVALAQAEANLAQTARQIRALYANNAPLQAQVAQRQADLLRLKADAQRAREDARRRAPLLQSGAVGQEEYQRAQSLAAAADNAVHAAEAGVRAAQAQLAAAEVQTRGSTAEEHPAVQAAAAKVREAWLAWERTRLLAPIAGFVAKRGVQLGQRVAAGAGLMTVVDLHGLWVDANFKESQLAGLRIGQPVQLHADVYGEKVAYRGQIVGLGAGTGAAFALLPAQNATGNWIKVVQRVPVRISLDAADLHQHPLRVGLSMQVQVDIRNQGGVTLAATPRRTPVAQTSVYAENQPQLQERIARIIAGQRVPPPEAPAGFEAGAIAAAAHHSNAPGASR